MDEATQPTEPTEADGPRRHRIRGLLITGAAVVGVALGSYAIAEASSGGDDGEEDRIEGPDTPIADADLDAATAAALAHTGGGTVTGTEVGDEESYYEVEVTLDDGSQVDVQLDEDFQVVGDEDDGPDEVEDD